MICSTVVVLTFKVVFECKGNCRNRGANCLVCLACVILFVGKCLGNIMGRLNDNGNLSERGERGVD